MLTPLPKKGIPTGIEASVFGKTEVFVKRALFDAWKDREDFSERIVFYGVIQLGIVVILSFFTVLELFQMCCKAERGLVWSQTIHLLIATFILPFTVVLINYHIRTKYNTFDEKLYSDNIIDQID